MRTGHLRITHAAIQFHTAPYGNHTEAVPRGRSFHRPTHTDSYGLTQQRYRNARFRVGPYEFVWGPYGLARVCDRCSNVCAGHCLPSPAMQWACTYIYGQRSPSMIYTKPRCPAATNLRQCRIQMSYPWLCLETPTKSNYFFPPARTPARPRAHRPPEVGGWLAR